MVGTRLALAAALLVAPGALLGGGVNATSSQAAGGDATASDTDTTGMRTWVGVVHASYSRDLARDDGGTEHTLASLNIATRANRTASATGSRRVRNEYPDPVCSTVYTEQGSLAGPVPRVTVRIFPDRYRVEYSASGGITPVIDVAIFDQRRAGEECRRENRSEVRSVLPVYIPIEGRATRKTTRVAGSLLVKNRYCTVPGCDETESATWDLHLADAVGGRAWRRQWRREWRRQGRPGVARGLPGAGCERNVIAGTLGDDRLIGTKRAELMLGLARNDRIEGRGGDDCLFGGPGEDVLLGGRGNDLLVGEQGSDVLNGGPGNDVLIGGPGRNRLIGGKGNDVILARNGQRDVIRCGPGFDVVIADRNDRVARDCEVVRRGQVHVRAVALEGRFPEIGGRATRARRACARWREIGAYRQFRATPQPGA